MQSEKLESGFFKPSTMAAFLKLKIWVLPVSLLPYIFDPTQSSGMSGSKKDKIPAHLQDQWDRDRAKKAEYKKARAQARLESAADPLSYKKGGKKGRKAMLAAARFDPSISIPGRVVDMVTVEQQIRRFLADIGGNSTMALPPMAKESRKQVHELAVAFNLKSASKGKGDGRYTTLTKTTRSGIRIDERKVRRILTSVNVLIQPGGGKGRNTVVMPRHRDGDEVGKVCDPLLNWEELTHHYRPSLHRQRRRSAKVILASGCLLLWDGLRETASEFRVALLRRSRQ